MKKVIALLMAVMFVFSLAACSKTSGEYYDIANADRATYFYNYYQRLVEKYGEPSFDGDKLQGVAVLKLIDFTGDGGYELYVAYADGTKDYVNRHQVIGFDRGPATILDEEITSKANAGDAVPQIWLYTDIVNRGFVGYGDSMNESADYHTYITKRGEEKIYAFHKEFTIGGASADEVDFDETYLEKIQVAGITEEDADLILEETQCVIDSMKSQSK